MSRICLITALAAETRPMLDALPFRQITARGLRLYSSDHFLLLETGLGKLNAAAATGAILQLYPDISVVVNIGIAGGLFSVGTTLVAHGVQDQASGAQWFPHLPDAATFRNTQTATIRTVDTPSTDYCEGVLFDMEAAGIFTASTRHLSTSQVHSIKVVSDNPENALQTIDKHTVNQLITDALPDITAMLDVLYEQYIAEPESAASKANLQDLDALISHVRNSMHHSVNDEQQLRRLVQQHQALTGRLPELLSDKPVFVSSPSAPSSSCVPATTASALRHQLRAIIADTPFTYDKI